VTVVAVSVVKFWWRVLVEVARVCREWIEEERCESEERSA